MTAYDVLLFDGYFCDLIITGLPEVPRLGADLFGQAMGMHAGGAFNTVRALHRLGLNVGWVCDFGDDLFSQFVLGEIEREGVDMRLLRRHARAVRAVSLSFSFRDDRGFISYIDPAPPVDRVPTILEHQPRLVLVTYLQTGPELEAVVQAARQAGAQIVMDCQSTTGSLQDPAVAQAIRLVDVFLPNASEAMQLTQTGSAEEALDVLSRLNPRVIIKNSAQGALASWQGQTLQSPPLPIEVVDTTGAGDCFNAGFIYSYLRGDSIESMLRYGNICGGLCATKHGTVAAPGSAQAEEIFRNWPTLYFE